LDVGRAAGRFGSDRIREGTMMHFFGGGSVWKPPYDETGMRRATQWTERCFSYWYVRQKKGNLDSRRDIALFLDGWRPGDPRKVLLDSGAYTFLTKNPGINDKALEQFLEGYMEFVLQMTSGPWTGAVYGYLTFDYTRDPAKVFQMTLRMVKSGFHPIPVWHCVADPYWLEAYIGEGFRLIGIGFLGTRDERNRTGRKQFLRRAFDLASKHGVAIHGLGIAGGEMFAFPWCSVDSVSWIRTAFRGSILVPDVRRGTIRKVHVSRDRACHPMVPSWSRLDPAARDGLVRQAERYGLLWEDVQSHGFHRAVFNVRSLQDAMASLVHPPRIWERVV